MLRRLWGFYTSVQSSLQKGEWSTAEIFEIWVEIFRKLGIFDKIDSIHKKSL
jgi:hypothetical protein